MALKADFLSNTEENLQRVQSHHLSSVKGMPYADFGSSELCKIFEVFEALTADLAIVLCAYRPTCFVAEVQDAFIHFWMWKQAPLIIDEKVVPLELPSSNIITMISPKNFALLLESELKHGKSIETWNRFEAFLGRLLKHKLVLPLVLEEQCLNIVKEEWPCDMLKRFASYLQGAIDSWRRSPGETKDFPLILDWLVWFVQEPDEFGSDNDLDNLENFPELR